MSDTKNPQPPRPQPNSDLAALDRLVGTWQLSGETEGTVTYEWMAGSFFLLRRASFTLHGHAVVSMEVIGHLQSFGEKPSPDIQSRAYDSLGNTLDYVYEIDRDTLVIWGGGRRGRRRITRANSAKTARRIPGHGSTRAEDTNRS